VLNRCAGGRQRLTHGLWKPLLGTRKRRGVCPPSNPSFGPLPAHAAPAQSTSYQSWVRRQQDQGITHPAPPRPFPLPTYSAWSRGTHTLLQIALVLVHGSLAHAGSSTECGYFKSHLCVHSALYAPCPKSCPGRTQCLCPGACAAIHTQEPITMLVSRLLLVATIWL
jgi:hypothetical protein